MRDVTEKILDQLKQGEAGAIPGKNLSKIIDVDERLIRKAIFDMRKNNVVILASEKGYFLPGIGELGVIEATTFIRMMQHRGRSSFLSIRCAKNFISKNNDQISFIDDFDTVDPYED